MLKYGTVLKIYLMPIDLGLQIADAAPASDWVRQSRVKEREVTLTKHQEAKRQAELQIQRQYEEEEELLLQQSLAKGKNQKQAYSAADLKGLKIMHDHTQFEVGQDVVLTLADTNILETGQYIHTKRSVVDTNHSTYKLFARTNLWSLLNKYASYELSILFK